ncbi:type VI secretion protein ImpB, partial [Stenotrophomonas maltophilia]
TPAGEGQADLFNTADPKTPALLAAMDGINARFGRNTVLLAAQGCGARSFDTKRSQKSPAWTTKIEEIPVAR